MGEGFNASVDRRGFLKNTAAVGAAAAGIALAGADLLARGSKGPGPGEPPPHPEHGGPKLKPTRGDIEILVAAQIAEALAVTTYSNIINAAPFFTRLESDDQGYLLAALQEEMSHYLLEQSVTDQASPFTAFYFPVNMFASASVTLNTLVTLEDAFIAAYLVGVRNFSNADLRVTAARIMGIESDHRTLARVVGPGVSATDGGAVEFITGAQGVAESVDPPNNNGYERTLSWTTIDQAVAALLPFADPDAAAKAGFDTSRAYTFVPFTPALPIPLGDFHSFAG